MKTLVSVFQKFKPWIISILILFLVIKLTLNYKYHTYLEAFTTATPPTSDSSHHIYITDGSQKTEYPSLTNIIRKIDGKADNYLENGFVNLYNKFGEKKFDESSYSTTIPQLIIQSYPECPTLYNLFRAYPKLGAEAKIKYYSNLVEEINKIVKTAKEKSTDSITARNEYMTDLAKYREAYQYMRVRVLIMQEEKTVDDLIKNPAPSETIEAAEEKNTKIAEIPSTYLSPSPAPAFEEPSSLLIYYFEKLIGYDSYYDTKLKSLLISTPNTIKEKLKGLTTELEKIKLLGNGMNGLYSDIKSSIKYLSYDNSYFNFPEDTITNFERAMRASDFPKLEDFQDTFLVNEITNQKNFNEMTKLSGNLNKFLEEVKYLKLKESAELIKYEYLNIIYRIIYTKKLYDKLNNNYDTIQIQKIFDCPVLADDVITFNFQSHTPEMNKILDYVTLSSKSAIIPKQFIKLKFSYTNKLFIILQREIIIDLGNEKINYYYNSFKSYIEQKMNQLKLENIDTIIDEWIDEWIEITIKIYGMKDINLSPGISDIAQAPSYSDRLNEYLDLEDKYGINLHNFMKNVYKLFYLGEKKIYNNEEFIFKYIKIDITNEYEISSTYLDYFLESEILYTEKDKLQFTFHEKNKISQSTTNPSFDYKELADIYFKNIVDETEQTISPCPSSVAPVDSSPSISQNIIRDEINKLGFSVKQIHNYFRNYIIDDTDAETKEISNIKQLVKESSGDIYDKIKEIITYLDSSSISPSPSGAPATYLPNECDKNKVLPGTGQNIFNDLKCYLENELEPVKNDYLQSKIDLRNLVQYIFRLNRLADQEQTVSEDEANFAAENLKYEIETNLLEIIEKKYRQNENRVGIEHRMKIQRQFFNLNQDIRVDYPLLDITVYDKNNDDFTPIVPQIYFSNQMYDTEEDFNSKAKGTEVLRYLEKGYDERNSHFAVKEDFSFPDILKFMDYSFTTLCWGAISIRLMKHTHNHYYAFPCQNSNCQNGTNSYFYLLPTKIAQLCRDEGKEYTRAKCNRCSSNVIVYFDTIPIKFLNLAKYQGSEDNTVIEDLIPSSS